MFGFAAFALAGLAGEFARGASAQRALAGGSWPAALGRLVSATAGATAATSSTPAS